MVDVDEARTSGPRTVSLAMIRTRSVWAVGFGAIVAVLLLAFVWMRTREPDVERDYRGEIQMIHDKIPELERYRSLYGQYPATGSVTLACASCYYAREGPGYEMGFGVTLDRAYVFHSSSRSWTMSH